MTRLAPWTGTLALLLLATPSLDGCGARSELRILEPCHREGAFRPCENSCGPGQQTCEEGFWRGCQVPETRRSCADDCGLGQQRCTDGTWRPCVVPHAERSCTDDCGVGVQACDAGKWLTCEVAPVEQACTNDCGTGSKRCEKNVWGSCEVARVEKDCFSACGHGVEVCATGSWAVCTAPLPKPPVLRGVVRDFNADHPDFEEAGPKGQSDDRGIIATALGPDDLPVFLPQEASLTVTSPSTFAQWYRDVPSVNMSAPTELQTVESPTEPGIYVYDNSDFFPIDNQLFGNEGRAHNYHFTVAVATEFNYVGRETFSFSGDDDMWVFINRRLAIDLGGVHTSESATIDLEARRDELGLVPGQRYSLHFFFAERHTVQSNFMIRTSIADIGACP